MIFSQNSIMGYNPSLMESVYRIMNTQLIYSPLFHSKFKTQSFIKFQDKDEKSNETKENYPLNSLYWLTSEPRFCNNSDSTLLLSSYCNCEDTSTSNASAQVLTNDDDFNSQNFETYKQLKKVAKESDPNISKEEIYEKLLEPFRHEKVKIWDQALGRFKISYICRYDECNKEFTKIWNLLDHVRMHEGIKPFVCKIWDKTFTQKGNLKKHNIIQHSTKSLKERKKFKCKLWSKRYTERYNLVVRFHILFINFFYSNYYLTTYFYD